MTSLVQSDGVQDRPLPAFAVIWNSVRLHECLSPPLKSSHSDVEMFPAWGWEPRRSGPCSSRTLCTGPGTHVNTTCHHQQLFQPARPCLGGFLSPPVHATRGAPFCHLCPEVGLKGERAAGKGLLGTRQLPAAELSGVSGPHSAESGRRISRGRFQHHPGGGLLQKN